MRLKDTIIGNERVAEMLEKNCQTSKLSHAYLFEGSEHIGKRTLALKFCELVLNNSKKNILENPDLMILSPSDSDKQITVEKIRELEKILGLSPYYSKYKIAVIEQAEKMNKAAANALLKTLEEPSKTTILILLSSNSKNVLDTIKSRCQRIKFLPVKKSLLEKFLKNKVSEKSEAEKIIEISGYQPGRIVEFLKHKEKNDTAVEDINRFSTIIEKSENDKINEAEIISKNETSDIVNMLDLWIIYCRKLLVKKYETYDSNEKKYLAETVARINLINKTKENILSKNVNIRLALENLILQM
ncbi:MAG: hypothetical protein U9N04_00965 [Patescibacteria group bacterium]|nr:hypothetical protein [Patescibacteria group bacterium]